MGKDSTLIDLLNSSSTIIKIQGLKLKGKRRREKGEGEYFDRIFWNHYNIFHSQTRPELGTRMIRGRWGEN